MNANQVESKFAMMGARFKMSVVPAQRDSNEYAVDIQRDSRGEFFELRVSEAARASLEVNVPQTDKRDRHLLLFVRPSEGKVNRFLCGHDEREWFVAAVPGGASSVLQAKAALKPSFVRAHENELKIPNRFRNRRKTAAFQRQGEWFFVPLSGWNPDRVSEKSALRNEPLRRGTGKPHLVDYIYRVGGETVYVCRQHPQGITEAEHRKLVWNNPNAVRWDWQVLRRNPRVYARGRVRHADHATITLPDWHRVVLNTETETESMRNVAFID